MFLPKINLKTAACFFVSAVAAIISVNAISAAPIIVNEYNCVSGSKYVGNSSATEYLFSGSPRYDAFHGRVAGNGRNWIELVVIQDHLDLRGWKLVWSYNKDAQNYGNGVVTFGNHSIYSDLRAGTILTVTEKTTAGYGMDTDISYDPANDDWWINVCSQDLLGYVSTTATITEGGVTRPGVAGEFAVNNDNWRITIKDPSDVTVFGPLGEDVSGCWAGTGINSREVAKLEDDPSDSITACSSYNGGSSSTFGFPNVWNASSFPVTQDFSALRATCNPPVVSQPMPITLGEAKTIGSMSGLVKITDAVVTWIGADLWGEPLFNIKQGGVGLGVYGTGVNVGDIVTITGTLGKRVNCERVLKLASIVNQVPGVAPKPMGMPGKNIGGSIPAGWQGAVMGYTNGPNNIGHYALVWGRVTAKGQANDPVNVGGIYQWFTINDGSNRDSGETGIKGIKIIGYDHSALNVNSSYVLVRGELSVLKRSETDVYPIIRVSSPSDVTVVIP